MDLIVHLPSSLGVHTDFPQEPRETTTNPGIETVLMPAESEIEDEHVSATQSGAPTGKY